MNYRPKPKVGGFTLLELLVTLVLFALLSLLTYNSLRAMIDSRQQTSLEGERLAALQMTMARLGLDIQQAQARGVRDENGDPQPSMLYGTGKGFEFTRSGQAHATPGRANGSPQRLRYLLVDHDLIRESRPLPDWARGTTIFPQTMLGQVKGFDLRFLDKQGDWHNQWPSEKMIVADSVESENSLPAAVEVWLELEDWGSLRRLFPLPAWQGP